jgi:hydroxyethylthiazole kinase-like uncharacterized protein yjeF
MEIVTPTFPTSTDDKTTRGVVAFLTGSSQYPGAAILGTTAAVCAGAGYVIYGGNSEVGRMVISARPEVVADHQFLANLQNQRNSGGKVVDVLVLGSGVGAPEAIAELVDVVNLHLNQPVAKVALIVDAGAAVAIGSSQLGILPDNVILTPNLPEFLNIFRSCTSSAEMPTLDEFRTSPSQYVQIVQQQIGGTVVLKGSTTAIRNSSDGQLVQNQAHNLATAGSGDVFAGLLCAILGIRKPSTGHEIVTAIKYATQVHASTARHLALQFGHELAPVPAFDVAKQLAWGICNCSSVVMK